MPYKKPSLWEWLRVWPATVYWRFFWKVPKDDPAPASPHLTYSPCSRPQS
jgi:hypothetical protein